MTCVIQIAGVESSDLPSKKLIREIYQFVKIQFDLGKEVFTIRIVDSAESKMLNKTFRQKDKPTNVLSFPGTNDLVLCHPVIKQEAQAQHKPILNHYTHLLIHGFLHLLGYNHEIEAEATEMEALEVDLLKHFNIPNPYEEQ